jgi:CcmD family protein
MPQNLGFLFAAFTITWVAFFVYLFYVQRLLAGVARRLQSLEQRASRTGDGAGRVDNAGG